jgi:hypothetical protein
MYHRVIAYVSAFVGAKERAKQDDEYGDDACGLHPVRGEELVEFQADPGRERKGYIGRGENASELWDNEYCQAEKGDGEKGEYDGGVEHGCLDICFDFIIVLHHVDEPVEYFRYYSACFSGFDHAEVERGEDFSMSLDGPGE